MKTKKSALLIGLVVLVGTFAYYRYAKDVFGVPRNVMAPSPEMVGTKELSAVVTYDAYEGKMDTLRFVVRVNSDGVIEEIQTLDAATNEVPEKKKEFNGEVNTLLRGKKLKEIDKVDKVAKASLTTAAFNKALGDLKAGL